MDWAAKGDEGIELRLALTYSVEVSTWIKEGTRSITTLQHTAVAGAGLSFFLTLPVSCTCLCTRTKTKQLKNHTPPPPRHGMQGLLSRLTAPPLPPPPHHSLPASLPPPCLSHIRMYITHPLTQGFYRDFRLAPGGASLGLHLAQGEMVRRLAYDASGVLCRVVTAEIGRAHV